MSNLKFFAAVGALVMLMLVAILSAPPAARAQEPQPQTFLKTHAGFTDAELGAFLDAGVGLRGASVTLPHKTDLLRFVRESGGRGEQ